MMELASVGEIDTPKPGLPRYLSQFDGIRAIAVLMVIAHHFSSWGSTLRLGIVGVYMFFVLSGFLITRILLGCRADVEAGVLTRRRSLRQFYIRRFFRIFPLYYAYLFLGLCFNIGGIRSYWGWFGAYLGNIFIAFREECSLQYVHFWSLAVEEQFYIFWPWLILFWPRRSLVKLCLTCIALGIFSKAFFNFTSRHAYAMNMMTPDCLDTLASGALLAIYAEYANGFDKLRRGLRYAVVPAILMLIIGPFVIQKWIAIELFSVGTCIGGSWLLVRAGTVNTGYMAAVLNWAPLRYIGTISYGIYVWHLGTPVFLEFAHRRLHLPEFGQNAQLLIVTLLSILLASGSWWLFERPINELKRYFPYRRPLSKPEPIATS